MKPFLLYSILALSLTANAMLLRSRLVANRTSAGSVTPPSPKANARTSHSADLLAAAWKTRQPDNLHPLADALRATGLTERMVRAIIGAEIDSRFHDRENTLRPPGKPPQFWQQDDTVLPFKTKLARLDLAREKRKQVDDVLGPDPDATRVSAGYEHISPEKRERVRLISEDYAVMLETMRNEIGTLPLPTDGEHLRLLEAERRRDLAAFLTPEELAEDEMRVHPFAGRIRELTQFFDATPEEFRAIFAAQAAILPMNSGLPVVGLGPATSAEAQRAREAERIRLNEQLKTTLGETRYAEYVRAKEYEFQRLADLVARHGLPSNTAVQVFEVRDFVSRESNRIFDAPALDAQQKRDAMKALADNARGQITTLLGPGATEAYARQWLNRVEQGTAFTFRENGASMRPLPAPPPK